MSFPRSWNHSTSEGFSSFCNHPFPVSISSTPVNLISKTPHGSFLHEDITGKVMGMCSISKPFSVIRCSRPRSLTFFLINSTGISEERVNFDVSRTLLRSNITPAVAITSADVLDEAQVVVGPLWDPRHHVGRCSIPVGRWCGWGRGLPRHVPGLPGAGALSFLIYC